MRKNFILILFLLTAGLNAQDRLFFKEGYIRKGEIVSISSEVVFFKQSDSSGVIQLPTSKLIMAEYSSGERTIFGGNQSSKSAAARKDSLEPIRNYFGVQPFGWLAGRFTFVYERLSKNGKVGLVLPFSLTFNVFNTLYPSQDSSTAYLQEVTGLSYIVGADVNFYFGNNFRKRFFVGPRIRYGTDQTINATEGYSIQTQFGWRINSPNRFSQHLSFGFGFIKVLSVQPTSGLSPQQAYSWYSVNYRVSMRW